MITTNLGVSTSCHMLRDGRWRQLVISCLVCTSSAKPRGHNAAQTGLTVFNPDRYYGTRSTSPAGLPRLGD